jgi:hypothetical protein
MRQLRRASTFVLPDTSRSFPLIVSSTQVSRPCRMLVLHHLPYQLTACHYPFEPVHKPATIIVPCSTDLPLRAFFPSGTILMLPVPSINQPAWFSPSRKDLRTRRIAAGRGGNKGVPLLNSISNHLAGCVPA